MDDRNPVQPALEPTDSDADDQSAPPPTDEPERLADGNYVGENNIAEGHVGGVMGGAHQQGGEGGGG